MIDDTLATFVRRVLIGAKAFAAATRVAMRATNRNMFDTICGTSCFKIGVVCLSSLNCYCVA